MSGNGEYSLWVWDAEVAEPHDSVGSVGEARRPKSPSCTVRCCMVGRSIVKSVALQKRMCIYG